MKAPLLVVIGALLLSLASTAYAEPPATQPSKLATERAEALKKEIKGFTLRLYYYGEEDRLYPRLFLSVPTIPDRTKSPFNTLEAQITEDQAKKLIDYLAIEGFLDRAKLPEPPSRQPTPPQGPVYVLGLSSGYSENLGWGLPMLHRLDGLRTVLDGDAAKSMDVLLGRLAGLQKEWEAAAPATQPAAIPFDTHNGYFVSNKFEPQQTESFVVLQDQKAFDEVFGVAMEDALVMADRPHRLPDDAFKSKVVVAAIKRGKAVWKFKVNDVTLDAGVLSVRYTATSTRNDATEFACPLIVSVPKGNYAAVEFVEDGKSVKKIALKQAAPVLAP